MTRAADHPERGISVPVPPPSLTAAPVQRVDIEGELGYDMSPGRGHHRVLAGDERGLPGPSSRPEDDGSFLIRGHECVEIDLTDNCIEVWSEDGRRADERPLVLPRVASTTTTRASSPSSCSAAAVAELRRGPRDGAAGGQRA
jgi:hypothetical protein